MLFYLTTLNLARFLTVDAPPSNEKSDKETFMAVDAWKHSNYLCRNYVLNGLSDALYGMYCGMKSTKELWETLDRKCKTEKEGMIINEAFQVPAMIEKLPPSWGDFRNYLKHKIKEMDMEALIGKLHIEDDNRGSDKKSLKAMVKANILKHGQRSKIKKKTRRDSKLGFKRRISKKAKFQDKYFNCNKKGHRVAKCRLLKRKKSKEAQMMEYITREVDEIDLSIVVSDVNLVGSSPTEWWVDTGVTRHVCSNKNLFTSFKPSKNGEKLFMGNSATSEIHKEGIIVFKMISGKELTLNNVLYVLDI
ncbi:uncharacterized protein LOC132799788 [Ziziphus jujuba]|uniref:Uncharacterized protein LOC132799788 n=1 Tax=Ziziphus jujuba TaxID=326968 RepID=A0ABM3ZVC1_ZIZJJ|nr:uncharacterized protein LOC132799788 [Ziziphus jujuba]